MIPADLSRQRLHVSFVNFGNEDILGLTAYIDTSYIFGNYRYPREIQLHAGDILLDSRFIKSAWAPGYNCGRRRFTLAHECAHQILFQLESEEDKAKCKQMYSARKAYSLRDLKSKEDWNEKYANALAAALLMVANKVQETAYRFTRGRMLISYDGRFNRSDKLVLEHLCNIFTVSRSTMAIRLEQLGLCLRRPLSEYYDPTEVRA